MNVYVSVSYLFKCCRFIYFCRFTKTRMFLILNGFDILFVILHFEFEVCGALNFVVGGCHKHTENCYLTNMNESTVSYAEILFITNVLLF